MDNLIILPTRCTNDIDPTIDEIIPDELDIDEGVTPPPVNEETTYEDLIIIFNKSNNI